jgi:hypothetical protein
MNTKFEQLSQAIQENIKYNLNEKGKQLLQTYYKLIRDIEQSVIPIIKPYVEDVERIKKELAVQIISTINSQKLGTKEFEVASRLDTLTSGGKNPIDGNQFVFNNEDPINQYIEKINESLEAKNIQVGDRIRLIPISYSSKLEMKQWQEEHPNEEPPIYYFYGYKTPTTFAFGDIHPKHHQNPGQMFHEPWFFGWQHSTLLWDIEKVS